jgi:hypothetical protein
VAGFVAAASFLGGQPFAPSNTKLSHHHRLSISLILGGTGIWMPKLSHRQQLVMSAVRKFSGWSG